jgi:hypothetical protein
MATDFLFEMVGAFPGLQMDGFGLVGPHGPGGGAHAQEAWRTATAVLGLRDLDEPGRVERVLQYFQLQQERNLHRFTPNRRRWGLYTFAHPGEDAASLQARHDRFVRRVESRQASRERGATRERLRKEYQSMVSADAEETEEVRSARRRLARQSAELLGLRAGLRDAVGETEVALVPVLLSRGAARPRLEQLARGRALARVLAEREEDERLRSRLLDGARQSADLAAQSEAHRAQAQAAGAEELAARAEEIPEAELPAGLRVLRIRRRDLERQVARAAAREAELQVEVRETVHRVRARLFEDVLVTRRSTL